MNIEKGITRRHFLELSSAVGGLVACGELSSLFAQQPQMLTEEQVFGPFYPVRKPLDRDADLTHLRGRRASAKG